MDFDEFNKNFADRLRSLRNEKKISAREMSLELGQNVNYINYIENGKHLPSMQGFFLICEYLNIQPSEFLKNHSEDLQTTTDSITFLSKLPKRQQDCLVSMVKEFVDFK